eukprot:scaffold2561_cov262-Alexandrium_tamarense.AAC.1
MHLHPSPLDKSTPAYPSARFDSNGYCIAHPSIRLCRLTNDGKYKIVCKTCFKCGSAGLMTDAHENKIAVHGYKKKGSKHREIPSLLTASGGGDGASHNHIHGEGRLSKDKEKEHRHAHGNKRYDRHDNNSNDTKSTSNIKKERAIVVSSTKTTDGEEKKRSSHTYRIGCAFAEAPPNTNTKSRSRTLSPNSNKLTRKSRGITLSPLRKSLSSNTTKVSSTSTSFMRKFSAEMSSPRNIKDVIRIKLPSLIKSSPKTDRAVHGSNKSKSSKVAPNVTTSNVDKSTTTSRYDAAPFNKEGCCNIHPDVHLAEKDRCGVWKVIQDACLKCNPTESEVTKSPKPRRRSSSRLKNSRKDEPLKVKDSDDKIHAHAELENQQSPIPSMKVYYAKLKEAKASSSPNKTALLNNGGDRCDDTLPSLSCDASPKSLHEITNINSINSSPQPAFSSAYFSRGSGFSHVGFPSLPLPTDDVDWDTSFTATVKQNNNNGVALSGDCIVGNLK